MGYIHNNFDLLLEPVSYHSVVSNYRNCPKYMNTFMFTVLALKVEQVTLSNPIICYRVLTKWEKTQTLIRLPLRSSLIWVSSFRSENSGQIFRAVW